MMTFDDLEFSRRAGSWSSDEAAGVQALAFFDNGYGASIVRGFGTYGSENGLYELAVLKGSRKNWGITYDTPITEDVEGHLTPDDVSDLLAKSRCCDARRLQPPRPSLRDLG
jgi:hypothetical protein